MVRYTLFILAVAGSAATAWAAITPGHAILAPSKNVTNFEMNEIWPLQGKLVVAQCAVEDCSDTPQG